MGIRIRKHSKRHSKQKLNRIHKRKRFQSKTKKRSRFSKKRSIRKTNLKKKSLKNRNVQRGGWGHGNRQIPQVMKPPQSQPQQKKEKDEQFFLNQSAGGWGFRKEEIY